MAAAWFRRALLPVPFLAVLSLFATGPLYRSVSVDTAGQLRIVLNSGGELTPRKLPGQSSFGQPALAPDGRTVGWLAMYPLSWAPTSYPVETPVLVAYRAGRILHRFTPSPAFIYSWQFQDGGNRVAYAAGFLHGGAIRCVLRDVDSGRVVGQWSVGSKEPLPAWAQAFKGELREQP